MLRQSSVARPGSIFDHRATCSRAVHILPPLPFFSLARSLVAIVILEFAVCLTVCRWPRGWPRVGRGVGEAMDCGVLTVTGHS